MKKTAHVLTILMAFSVVTPVYPIEIKTWRYLSGFGTVVGAFAGLGIYKKLFNKEKQEKSKTGSSTGKTIGSVCAGAVVGGLAFAWWFYSYRPDARLAQAQELITSALRANRLQNFIDDAQRESELPQPVLPSAPPLEMPEPERPIEQPQQQQGLYPNLRMNHHVQEQQYVELNPQLVAPVQPYAQAPNNQAPVDLVPVAGQAAQQQANRRTVEEIACTYFRRYPMVHAEENMDQASRKLEQAQQLCADAAEDILNDAHLTQDLEITRTRIQGLLDDSRRFGRQLRMHYRYDNEVANELAERVELRRVVAAELRARAANDANCINTQLTQTQQQARLAQQQYEHNYWQNRTNELSQQGNRTRNRHRNNNNHN